MPNNESSLPAKFAELERFVADWAIDTEAARNKKRVRSSMEDLDGFYNAVFPRLTDIANYIDQYSLDAMPQDAARLLYLALMLMEVSPPVEVYRTPDVPKSFEFDRFHIISPRHAIAVRG